MKRSLAKILRTNFPDNLWKAFEWLLWTVGSVAVSIIISCAVNYSKTHYVSLVQSITHGELFAFSASLVIGAGRLILKDEDLEDFVGRQYFGLMAFLCVLASEVLFFVWKLDDTGANQGPLGKISIWMLAVSLFFVFSVVLIDASRIPRPNLTGKAGKEVDDLMKHVERGL